MSRAACAAVFAVVLTLPGVLYAQGPAEAAVESHSAVPHQLVLHPATAQDLAEMQYYLIRKQMIPQEAEVAKLQVNLKATHPVMRDALQKLERLQRELDTIQAAAKEVGIELGRQKTEPGSGPES